tara:strand:- start:401 stop:1162 length:762 start_codon:yes stop_codon:yes gene_type:complete
MFLQKNILPHQTVSDIVSKDYRYAKALDSFGVDFYKYFDYQIEDLCKIKGFEKESLIGYRISLDESFDLEYKTLKSCPLNLVIEYLRHNHNYFIKNKLPYIQNLIRNLDISSLNYNFSDDLKFIFPLFYEEFTDHIIEEEKIIFKYINKLFYADNNFINPSAMFFLMKGVALKEIAEEHLREDSEMSGIRGLTNNYSLSNINDLHMKVIFQELKDFDKELEIHSDIENKILFPRALDLQYKISNEIRNISFLN